MPLRLAWFTILLIAIYGLVIGGAWLGIYTAELRIVTMFLTAALLGAWSIVALRKPAWRPRSVLWPAIVAVLASLAMSTITSRVQRVSLEYLGYAIVLVALYLLLVAFLRNPFFRERLIAFASMSLVVIGILLIGVVLIEWVLWWQAIGHVAIPPLRPGFVGLTYGNPSAVLVIVVMLAMPALATFGRATLRGVAAIFAILALVAVVALLSGSRAGWLAMALTAGLTAIAWLLDGHERALLVDRLGRHLRSRRRRVSIGAIAVAAIAVLIVLLPPILQRVTAGGEVVRFDYSLAALRMFVAAPVLGLGPGSWAIERPAFTVPGEFDDYVPYAHNLETQTLAELGIVGALAGVVVVVSLVWLIRSALTGGDRRRRRWAIVAAIGLTYFGLHQMLDFFENMPAILFVAAIPIAVLDATTDAMPTFAGRTLSWPKKLGPVLAGTTLIAVVGLTLQEVPAMHNDQALNAANEGNWAAAYAPAQAAASEDPGIAPFSFTAGLAASRAGDHQAALADFARVVQTDDVPEAWLNLAAEQLATGDAQDVAASVQRALRIGFSRPDVAMAAGDLLLRTNDLPGAAHAFLVAIQALPSLAADPWWQGTPQRAAALQQVTSALLATKDPNLWELALMTGDATLATNLASRLGDPRFAETVIDAWIGSAPAAAVLTAQCDRTPLDAGVLYWCARLAERAGDTAKQSSYLFIASLTPDFNLDGGGEIRVAQGDLVGRSLAGTPAIFWGFYVYRRATPWDVLVPSLVHLTVV